MFQAKKVLECPRCGEERLHTRARLPWWMGLLAILLSGGTLLPIVVIIWVVVAFQSWRCNVCGEKVLSRAAGGG